METLAVDQRCVPGPVLARKTLTIFFSKIFMVDCVSIKMIYFYFLMC